MKKSVIFRFLVIALLVLSVGCTKINNRQNDIVTPPLPPGTKYPTEVRLATNIQNADIIPILNKYARPTDIIEVRKIHLPNLASMQAGTILYMYGKNDDQTEAFQLAKEHNIKIIAFNLEDAAMTKEELVAKETQAYELAKAENLTYGFAPLAIHCLRYGSDLAQHADIIAIQLRNWQLMSNFSDEVRAITSKMRAANPNIEIWGQLDVNPRIPGTSDQRQSIDSDEIIREINLIKDDIDVMDIYYPPKDATVAGEVFIKLRQ
jgi:hypothetical protein